MRSLFFILLCSCLIFSCKENKPIEDKKPIVNDTALALRLNHTAIKFELPSILNGSENIYDIRIWVSSIADPDNFIRLVNDSTSTLHFFYNYYVDSTLKENYEKSRIENINLVELQQDISKFEIENFINQKDIPGFKDDIADGVTYHLEIAKPYYYKLITYHCPDIFADADNKKFFSFIMMLDRYFHFYSPMCKQR